MSAPSAANPIFPIFTQNSGQGMQIVVDFSNLAACLPPYEKKMNLDDKWNENANITMNEDFL
jgi:hypothetical protein